MAWSTSIYRLSLTTHDFSLVQARFSTLMPGFFKSVSGLGHISDSPGNRLVTGLVGEVSLAKIWGHWG